MINRLFYCSSINPPCHCCLVKRKEWLLRENQAFNMIRSTMTYHAYNRAEIDFNAISIDDIPNMHELKRIIGKITKACQREGIHVLTINAPSTSGKIVKVALDCGFKFHHADSENALLNKRVNAPSVNECLSPRSSLTTTEFYSSSHHE